MAPPHDLKLSRREREIMDLVYRLGEATAFDVARLMHEDPGYDSVRVTMGILHKKGHLRRHPEGRRWAYRPAVSPAVATRSALGRLVQTFFGGSPSRAILAMIDLSSDRLSVRELEEIAALIEKGRRS